MFFVLAVPVAQAKPGDLFIGDSGDGQIVRISHKSAHQKVVAQGHHLSNPDSGAFDDKGRLVVGDYDAFGSFGGVFRINVGTGGVQTLASGAPFGRGPTDVAITPNGKIYTVDSGAGVVFRIDPKSGARRIVASGGKLGSPLGVAALSNKKLLVSDAAGTMGAVIAVNVKTGHQTFVVQRGDINDPYGITLSPNGKHAYAAIDLPLADQSIVRVAVKTGAVKTVAHGAPFDGITDVAMGLDGKLYVVDDDPGHPEVLKVDPKSGHVHVFAHGGKLTGPEGITIQPR